ncbi:MAG: hypothetical protein EZS28_042201, partial [Streblomastix strix]
MIKSSPEEDGFCRHSTVIRRIRLILKEIDTILGGKFFEVPLTKIIILAHEKNIFRIEINAIWESVIVVQGRKDKIIFMLNMRRSAKIICINHIACLIIGDDPINKRGDKKLMNIRIGIVYLVIEKQNFKFAINITNIRIIKEVNWAFTITVKGVVIRIKEFLFQCSGQIREIWLRLRKIRRIAQRINFAIGSKLKTIGNIRNQERQNETQASIINYGRNFIRDDYLISGIKIISRVNLVVRTTKYEEKDTIFGSEFFQ